MAPTRRPWRAPTTTSFVRADEPTLDAEPLADAERRTEDQPAPCRALYDAVYETALEQQVPTPLIDQLIRIFAFDVDFQARISPGRHARGVPLPARPDDRDAGEPEILFASLTLGGVDQALLPLPHRRRRRRRLL